MEPVRSIQCVAILGAGVMGAQIAAHCVNAKIRTILFDLPNKTAPRHLIVQQAIAKLAKLKPAPLATPEFAELITPANYEDDLALLQQCDLILEAVAERIDIKTNLYKTIAPYVASHAILASNTSGLGINELSHVLPIELRSRFLGIHFFNPPRYMHLAELIPSVATDPAVMDWCENLLVSTLGKGVVRAHDTPNFIANRIGVFSLLITMHYAKQLAIPLDVVDILTGPAIGRPKSATFRTMDVVGLDTMAHVVNTMKEQLKDDQWHALFQNPDWLTTLIAGGALGQKTGAGVYKKVNQSIHVFDIAQGNYRLANNEVAPEVASILAMRNTAEKITALRACAHPQAIFLWSCLRDIFHYVAVYCQAIADNVQAVDHAMEWGFGWRQGPFALWQTIGWDVVRQWLVAEIAAGKTAANTALPEWVMRVAAVYTAQGAFAPNINDFDPGISLPVYQRQQQQSQTVLYENPGVILTAHEGVATLSFKSKLNVISPAVIDGIVEAITCAEQTCIALVLWQPDKEHFSAGADLRTFAQEFERSDQQTIAAMLGRFQQAVTRLRYATIPTVAAIRGQALGGGAELVLHCQYRVAAIESYIGLVEIGVGLLPAGGGCTTLAMLAATQGDPVVTIGRYFETIAMAKVSGSAYEAKALGLLQPEDHIVMHSDEVRYIATQFAKSVALNHRPTLPRTFAVAGDVGIANCQTQLVNLREGGFISEHDYRIALAVATILCGGDVTPGTQVDAAWLHQLEREAFAELALTPATQARIEHMLATGKPLRN